MEPAFPFDAREFVRVRARLAVFFRLCEDGREFGRTREGATENLSAGGLLLHAQFPEEDLVSRVLAAQAPLALEFALVEGDPEPVRGLARIVWVEAVAGEAESCRMGVRFREMSARDRDRIVEFVVRHCL